MFLDDDNDIYVPAGYVKTMDCLDNPKDWDVPGIIASMAQNLRQGDEVAEGQLLAALEWMTSRLTESRKTLVCADSELSAVGHGRVVDKEESLRVSGDARTLTEKLKGF